MQSLPPGHLHHPDLPPAHSAWSEGEVLHVAACHLNPQRWRVRRELTNDFRRHMATLPNVRLHMIEVAFGDRPFEVTDPSLYPGDIQLRTSSELFLKENALNVCIARSFPNDWRYGAWIDADFHFTRHDIGLETIHQLQHHAWVQMFSEFADLDGETTRGQGHRILLHRRSFMATYVENDFRLAAGFRPNGELDSAFAEYPYEGGKIVGGKAPRGSPGATGGAWAFTRAGFEATGGLIDRCILGSGDWFMAFGLVGDPGTFPFVRQYHPGYRAYVEAWQERAATLRKNVGYVDCFAVHHHHGPKVKRAYGTRDQILVDHQYDPTVDVYPDWQGLLQLSPGKPRFRDEIRRYFRERNEDAHEPL